MRIGGTQRYQASMTVEMSFLMPIILLLFMSCMFGIFYFHDKAVIAGAAYETAVVGSTKMREREQVKEGELKSLFQKRVSGKCIFFGKVRGSVSIGKAAVVVKASASKRGMGLSVEKQAAITEPEKEIRKKRRVKELINGT